MARRWLTFIVSTTLVASAFSLSVFAQSRGNGKNKQIERDDERYSDRDDNRDRSHSIIFTSRDRDIIREYFRGGYSNLPPGLAKRGGNLPPGLEKHLERDGTLPPGLQKRLTVFPPDLERRLPRLPDIYERGSIGGSVVIIDRRTQRIMDVIYDILRP